MKLYACLVFLILVYKYRWNIDSSLTDYLDQHISKIITISNMSIAISEKLEFNNGVG